MSRLADRLSAARRRRFIGRAAEQALFHSALLADELPFFLLYVYGPGGVGKTSLLYQFNQLAEQVGVNVVLLDARNLEPTADSFLTGLNLALGNDPATVPTESLARDHRRTVLFLDTYELLAPLDSWLRETLLPQLPDHVLTVIASRNTPAQGWRSDPGWQPYFRSLRLHNLAAAEGRHYLLERHVPAEDLQAVLDFTHSYPLALSLVADLYDQRPGFHFRPLEAPDVIKLLLEQLLQQVPGPAHRAALESCALVRVTTENLLAELLTVPDAHELFEWLRGLSFMQIRPGGLFPHDIAREALIADLRWRNPGWYTELHRRARVHYTRRLQQTQGAEQQLPLFDFIYLHRDNPTVRPFFEWQTSGRIAPNHLRLDDLDCLATMVARHEGDTSAQFARFWLERQPENTLVFHDTENKPAGFLLMLALERADAADLAADPATACAWSFLHAHAPLRAGESATYFRFWLAADTYQSVSPIQSIIFINMVRHYFSPNLAYTFYTCAEPDFWQPVFSYADLARLPELDYTINSRHFGVFGHDWRALPAPLWLDLMGQRELATLPASEGVMQMPPRGQTIPRDDFIKAVENALREYTRPDILQHSPLLRSRAIAQQIIDPEADDEVHLHVLRALLKDSAEKMRDTPRENKYFRAVYHTYIQPAATQEQAAELLDVPFSSYRRHLKAGMARIAEFLWQMEIRASEK